MYSDVNYQGDDYYNSHLLSELRTGGRDYVMGYRLVTGLYVTNYICLAPDLLFTDYGSR